MFGPQEPAEGYMLLQRSTACPHSKIVGDVSLTLDNRLKDPAKTIEDSAASKHRAMVETGISNIQERCCKCKSSCPCHGGSTVMSLPEAGTGSLGITVSKVNHTYLSEVHCFDGLLHENYYDAVISFKNRAKHVDDVKVRQMLEKLRNKDHPLVRTQFTDGKAELKVMGINIDGLTDDVLKQKILDVVSAIKHTCCLLWQPKPPFQECRGGYQNFALSTSSLLKVSVRLTA
ncbi:unnamed protein product [Calypogeia fissa]